jgi:hypothetical protein
LRAIGGRDLERFLSHWDSIALTIGSSLAFVIHSVDRSLHRASPKLISFPHLTLKSRIYLHPYTTIRIRWRVIQERQSWLLAARW